MNFLISFSLVVIIWNVLYSDIPITTLSVIIPTIIIDIIEYINVCQPKSKSPMVTITPYTYVVAWPNVFLPYLDTSCFKTSVPPVV